MLRSTALLVCLTFLTFLSGACARTRYYVDPEEYVLAKAESELTGQPTFIRADTVRGERLYLDARQLEAKANPAWAYGGQGLEPPLGVARKRYRSTPLWASGVATMVAGAALVVAGAAVAPRSVSSCGSRPTGFKTGPDPKEVAEYDECLRRETRYSHGGFAAGLILSGIATVAGGTVMVSIGASPPRLSRALGSTEGFSASGEGRVQVSYEGRF